MFSRISTIPLALVALGNAGMASASDYDEGQWITRFTAGSDLMPHGTFSPEVTGSVADLGSIDPSLAGEPGATTLNHLSFHDAFRLGPAFSVETGYMAQADLEPFLRLSYAQKQGRNAKIGEIGSPAFSSPAAISADFGDMDSWSLDLGTRYFLADNGTFRTYLAGYMGVERTDALHADLAISGMPASTREEFLPEQTRFNAGVEGGVAWQLSSQADLGMSVGAQYLDARRAQSDAFAPLGIEEMHFTEQHWSLPVALTMDYKF